MLIQKVIVEIKVVGFAFFLVGNKIEILEFKFDFRRSIGG